MRIAIIRPVVLCSFVLIAIRCQAGMQTLAILLPFLLLALPHLAISNDTKEGNKDNKLNVLLMAPCFHHNRSHVNFALSLYMAIRKQHNIRFVVLYANRKDVDFLETIAAATDENNRIELFDMGASENQEVIKIVQQDGTTLEKKFTEGIKDASYAVQMHFFPYMWMDYMERNNLVPNKHSSDANPPPVVIPPPRYDVGIAEVFSFSQHAFAVFHALGIPHCIPTGAMSPSAQHYEDLGLLDQLVAGNIPPLEKTEFGDHNRRAATTTTPAEAVMVRTEEDGLLKLYKDTAEQDKNSIDAIDSKLFNEKLLPGFKGFSLREKFRRAPLYFYNTRPQLEFDGGKVLSGSSRLRMIAGVHVKGLKELKKQLKALHNHIAKKIERIGRQFAKDGGFQGIVLISFGTVISTTNPKKMSVVHFDVLREVIAAHPRLLFIWKLTKEDERIEELNELPNVYSTHWVDQQAILSDSRTLAFVSHCGRNSQFEAALFGVPLICVPFFADQFYNAESTARQQLGSVLNFFCVELAGQQYAIRYSRLSGRMDLVEAKEEEEEGIDQKDGEDVGNTVDAKFLKEYGQRTVTVKGRDGGADREENVLTLMKELSEICFTPANITAKLEEAIEAKATLKKAIAAKDYSKSALAKVMQQLKQSPAAGLVLEALGELLKEKKTMNDAGTSSQKKRQKQKPVNKHKQQRRPH